MSPVIYINSVTQVFLSTLGFLITMDKLKNSGNMSYGWQDLKKKLRNRKGKGKNKHVDKPIKNINKGRDKRRRIPSLRLDAFKDKGEMVKKLRKMPEEERELLLNKTISQKEKLAEIAQDQGKTKKVQETRKSVKELKRVKEELKKAS